MKYLRDIAKNLRYHSISMTAEAGSGHPTSCLSCADIMSVLFFHVMRYDIKKPNNLNNDDFILSKGHAAPILWAAYAEAGIIHKSKLKTLRKIDSILEGHPTARMPWIRAATGSLGQGLSVGVGIALGKRYMKVNSKTFVMLGDGEIAEGMVWEAANTAGYYKLNNLVAVVDANRLGQSQPTSHQHKLESYKKMFESFGWKAVIVDGHSVSKLVNAFKPSTKPLAVIAKTFKGKGVSFLENKEGWHGKPLTRAEIWKAEKSLGINPYVESEKYVKKPSAKKIIHKRSRLRFSVYKPHKQVATRKAYGNILVKLGKSDSRVVAIDGDTKNSTGAQPFFEAFPKRGFESFIAEQNMAGMAIGLSSIGLIPFVATFGAFLSRAHDVIRMAQYSDSFINFVGSHSGVSIGQDGPSQMGLEDIAMFRCINGSVVLYPCDAISTEKLTVLMSKRLGINYLRTTRGATPIIYDQKDNFRIGGCKVLRKSKNDMVTVVSAGITVHEALKVANKHKGVRVIDAYSIKPLDRTTIQRSVDETKGNVIVVEDHYAEGGLGETVFSQIRYKKAKHLCVRGIPRSGYPEELMKMFNIDASAIAKAVRSFI